jgi:hypothetical protein
MIVLRSTLFAFAWLLALAGQAQSQSAGSERVPLPVRPQVGQVWIVDMDREKTSTKNGKSKSGSAKIIGRIEITSVSETGYDITWTTRSVTAGGVTLGNGDINQDFLIGVPLGVRLDIDGTPLELKDWDNIRENLIAIIDKVVKEPIDEKARTLAADMFRGWDANLAAQVLLKEVAALSICQGTELAVGTPHLSENVVPNPLGGSPIDGTSTYTLLSVDEATGLARLGFKNQLDPESATRSIKETLERVAAQTGRDPAEVNKELGDLKLISETTADCTIDVATGFTTSVDYETRISFGKEEARDLRRIRMVPASDAR